MPIIDIEFVGENIDHCNVGFNFVDEIYEWPGTSYGCYYYNEDPPLYRAVRCELPSSPIKAVRPISLNSWKQNKMCIKRADDVIYYYNDEENPIFSEGDPCDAGYKKCAYNTCVLGELCPFSQMAIKVKTET